MWLALPSVVMWLLLPNVPGASPLSCHSEKSVKKGLAPFPRWRNKKKLSVCLSVFFFFFFLCNTNHSNEGLISVDRGTKATLIRTIPSSGFKSSTEDPSFPIFQVVIQLRLMVLLRVKHCRYNIMILARRLLLLA